MKRSKAEANLTQFVSPYVERQDFRSMHQERIAPHKWVVRKDYSAPPKIAGRPAPKAEPVMYAVVGLNHAGYMAKVALRTADKNEARRAAALLNKSASV